jgi:hypothetical protein
MSAAWAGRQLMPMSVTSTRPQWEGPSPCSSPGFNAANVTVRVARTAAPEACPVSASTPDAMSMARTGVPASVVGASY